MKVALLYSGPYRGNAEIVNNHIQTFGLDVDVYVSTFSHYLNDWKESGLNIKEYYITPSVDFKQTDWFKQRNDEPGQAGFWQYWNLSNLIKNMPNDYDFYIKNRCDLQFSEVKLNMESFKRNTIYSSSHSFHGDYWHREHLINDQFYIGDWNSINTISDFVTNFYKKDRHRLNEAGPYVGSNEASLRQFLNEAKINVEALDGIKYIKNHNKIHTPSGISGFQLENI